ncbi:threonine-rich gpi-anchored glycoprotein, partial [Biomphalaria glabrata]
ITVASGSPFPPWLVFNTSSKLLAGIPLATDPAVHYMSVSGRCLPVTENRSRAQCTERTDVFQLTVATLPWDQAWTLGPANTWPTEKNREQGAASLDNLCDGEKVLASLVLCASVQELNASRRLYLAHHLASFMNIPVASIQIEPSTTQFLVAIQNKFQMVFAGPGSESGCDLSQNIEILWALSCSSVRHLRDFAQVLQHNVDGGRLQEELGLALVGWYVASSNSLNTRHGRRRRGVGGSTPIPTPAPAPVRPTSVTMVSSTGDIVSSSYMTTSITPTSTSAFTRTVTQLPSSLVVSSVTEVTSPGLSISSFSRDSLTSSLSGDLSSSMTDLTNIFSSGVQAGPDLNVYITERLPEVRPTSLQHSDHSDMLHGGETTEIKVHPLLETSSHFPPYSSAHDQGVIPSTQEPPQSSILLSFSVSYIQPINVDPPTVKSDVDDGWTSSPVVHLNVADGETSSQVLQRDAADVLKSTLGPHQEAVTVKAFDLLPDTDKVAYLSQDSVSIVLIPSSTGAQSEQTTQSEQTNVLSTSASFVQIRTVEIIAASDYLRTSLAASVSSDSSVDVIPSDIVTLSDSVILSDGITLSEGIASPDSATLSDSVTSFYSASPSVSTYMPDKEIILDQNVDPNVDKDLKVSVQQVTLPLILVTSLSDLFDSSPTAVAHLSDAHSSDGPDTLGAVKLISTSTPVTSGKSVSSEISVSSVTPVSSQTTVISETPVTSGTLVTSETPVISETTDSSETPAISGTPVSVEKSFTSKAFITSEAPVSSEAPVTSEVPASSEMPVTPEAPVTSQKYVSTMLLYTTTNAITPNITSDSVTQQTHWLHRQDTTQVPHSTDATHKLNSTSPPYSRETTTGKNMTFDPWTTRKPSSRWTTGRRKTSTTARYTTSTAMSSSTGLFDGYTANNRPYVSEPIKRVVGQTGQVLNYPIGPDVFNDVEDGDTRSLTLSLETPSSNYWLYLDSDQQVLRGLPLKEDFTLDNTSVYLMATDSAGNFERTSIALEIVDPPRRNFTHSFVMTFDINFRKFMEHRRNITELVKKLGTYFGDTGAQYITVLNVRQGSLILSWTNQTLTGPDCPRNAIDGLYRQMNSSLSDLRVHIGQNLKLKSVTREDLGVCLQTKELTTTIHPVSNKLDHGFSIWAHVVLPVLIAFLVFVLIILIIIFCNRRRRHHQAVINAEKEAISNDRNPIIFPDEIETDDPVLQAKDPLVLPSDIQTSNQNSPSSSPTHHNDLSQDAARSKHLRDCRDQEWVAAHSQRREEKSRKHSKDSSGGRKHSRDGGGRKQKDRMSGVSASSSLSFDRPNNHYLDEDEASSRNNTLTSNKSTGSDKRHAKQPPPYWQSQTDPPPYRLPPPYLNNTTQV